MRNPAKRALLLFARKACALLLAYCFFATSVWSLTMPMGGQAVRRPVMWTSLSGSGLNEVNHALTHGHSIANAGIQQALPNLSGLKTPMMPLTMQATGGATATVGFFGPQQYVRTTGNPNTYTTTVQVPAWVGSPFNLHIQSGEADGTDRVSSATITVNNTQVAVPSDFNQNVFTLDRSVTLTPVTTMVVTLASKPGSYLRINLGGTSHDHTPPLLTIAVPVTNSAINTPQAHLDLHYQDLPGAGETAASGVNTTTLQVLLDGVDRTSLFVKRSDEATADLPASLALSPGPHTLSTSIKDNAGNTAQSTSQFQLDVTPPSLQILQPAAGAYLNTTTPQIQLAYSDNFAIDSSTLRVSINGVDRTSAFTTTATGATAVLGTPLATGPNSIVATIADKAGNHVSASASFNVDTAAPVITILHPAPGTRHGSSTVEFSVQFTDDQAIDANTLQVNVDGAALGLTLNQNVASGTSTLGDGSHTVTATIKDKAGNQGSATSTFIVDTAIPDIHITQPAPGAILNTGSVQVQVFYGDNTAVNASSLQVSLDGVNVTSSLSITGTAASGLLQGSLAEGNHTIAAQITSQTGNTGQTSSTFLIDTIRPQLTILSPLGAINTRTPSAVAQYSDSGSGINVNSVHVLVDGTDVTSSFSIGASSVQGVFSAALSEGTHQLRVTVADRAGNVAEQSAAFQVDVTAPTAAFTSPADNAFTNNLTPAVVLTYSDALSGVDANSIHIFLQPLNGAESEVTSSFTLGVSQVSGTISTPLAAGTYHLRAQVADKAGNITNAESAFAVDTTPPAYNIEVPAANALLKTATPSFVVTYQDDSSGVDPHQFALRVDGTDHTAGMSANETGASGALQASEALSEGPHQVEVTVIDRAGNQAAVVPQPFFVDTIAPAISITAPPAAAFTSNNRLPIAVSYSDSGSGIDVTSFRISIDGVDHTAEFTAMNTGASGAPVASLADGPHSIAVRVSDFAGNTATATSSFVVDTIPPQITITQPVDGVFTNAVSLIVSGSVLDASPVVVTVEGANVPLQGSTFTSAAINLGANGPQVLHIVATDAAGNSSTTILTVKIDRTSPVISGTITPAPNAAGWNNTAVTVTFACSDADSGIATCPAPVPVDVEGTNQSITGTSVDNAGNTAQALVKVSIDKTPPLITSTPAPPPNAAGWNISDVTVSYACSDNLSGVVACPAPQVVSAEGKAEQITATVSDQAGNTAASTVVLNIEKTAPLISALLAPAANAAGWNKTDVSVSFNCTPSVSDILSCPPPVAVMTEGKAQSVSGSVTDQAGKSGTATAIINIDKTPPLISANTAPAPNSAGWNNTDVVISYLCSDSLSGIAVCPPPATVSAEGANENVTAQAVDQAGNTAVFANTLNIDKTPPAITASAAPPPNGAGWNNANVTVSYSCTDNLSGVASCPSSALVASEGQNQNISGQATDVAGNVATGSITISIDKTPPSIVQISTPDHISRLHSGQISVTVDDNFSVQQVVINVNGAALGTFTSAPYQASLSVPAGANPGDTLTVSVQATDQAGNVQTASRGVRVAADGVVVGQVLSDVTSFPVQGASVQAIAKTGLADQTDTRGRYSLQVSDSHLFVNVSSPGSTTVEREVFVQEGVGTVPVDARVTPLAAPVPVGSAGGTVKSGNVALSIPAGTVMDGTTMQLTSLSGQGLPGLLPLGWSPIAAFDVRASSSVANISATVTQLPNVVSHLVIYDPALHAWTMVSPNIQAVNGNAGVTLPAPGAYALVVPDTVDPPITVPNPGNALTGIDMQVLSPSSTSSGSLSPAILPPSGGTATATLGVQATSYVPSGTVIQANVSEKFSLKSGDVVSEENRSEDIVLYNAIAPTGATLGAKFPVVPSRKFANAELLTGKVHLDILAGREGVRGQPGGSGPLVLSDGVTTLSVPGGALSEDTAISIQSITFEDFIPVSSSLGPLQEVVVDFSGETLNTPAQLSTSATGLNPAHSFLLTKVERVDGIPRIVTVALAQIYGANLTSVASPGLPGVTEGGEYVFYELSAPSGFIQGTVSTSAGAVQALVQTDLLPLVSITGADGRYILPALSGSANVKAGVPHTNLLGTASVQVTAGQTTPLDITLSGTVTNAVVSPADGALGVPASTVITVTTTAPINPQSISQGNLVLLKGTASAGTPVALQPFVLSSSGTVLSFAPQKNLDPATQYTIQVSRLADNFGSAVIVPPSSFTTKAVALLNFDPNALTFSFPDTNGNIHVGAPAGSLPPGTKVLIIDQSSGLVLSLTALNDGSVSGDFVGTINDVLQITVTDPNGATATFTKSQFIAADGTVAVGPGGGTVTGPGGVAMIIPQGALDKGVTFKVEAFGPDKFSERPDVPGGIFGGGLKITSPGSPAFKKEVKVAFSMPPDAPPGAFFQVFSRMHTPDNSQVTFEDVDFALPQGQGSTAQVVTASFPYRGLIDLNMLLAQADFEGQVLDTVFSVPPVAELGLEADMYLIWMANDALPGISLGGSITGRVRYAVAPGGTLPDGTVNKTGDNVFVGVSNAFVTVDSNPPSHAVPAGATGARTQPDGSFTFSDPHYNGGTVKVIAYDGNGHAVTTTAAEVVALTDKTVNDFAGPLLKYYRNVAFADMVVPAPAPPPPTPKIAISLFTLDPNGLRIPANGLITDGTPLILAFKVDSSIAQPPNVTINGVPLAAQPDAPDAANDPLTQDFRLTDKFVSWGSGIYKIVATGVTAFLQTVTSTRSFLVVAAGGSNNDIKVGIAPEIVSTNPTANTQKVPVDTFVQVLFSEPVTNLPGNISLVADDGSPLPELQLSGIDYRNGAVISSLGSADAVSSLTIRPVSGLKFGVHYTIQATSNIKDLDNVADPTKPALSLIQPASPIGFTTVGPQVLGGTDPFSSTRVVVMGGRAYIAKQENATLSFIHAYDLTDPSNPIEVGMGTAGFIGRAQDSAGEENASVLGGGDLLAVGAGVGAFDFGLPSNLWLYNVGGGQIQRVGAVSVTGSTVNEGQLLRVTLQGNFAYSGTYPLGIQVVDLQQAITEYDDVFTHDPTKFGQEITTDGEGFARDAVVNTIPVNDASGHHYMVFGIQAGEFLVPDSDPFNPVTQTYVVSAGVVPGSIPNTISFVVADPTSPAPPAYADILKLAPASLDSGRAVALGQLTDSVLDANGNTVQKPVAVVVGLGSAADPDVPGSFGPGGVLTVVDMTNPTSPEVLSMIKLPASPIDVVLYGTTALIGTGEKKVLLVKLTDPRQPLFAGEIDGPLGDRLAVTSDGLLVTSSLNGAIGGIQTADLTGTRQPHLRPRPRPELGPTKDCEQAAGSPINLVNGNVWVTQNDYSLPGLGGGIQISRTWNSLWQTNNPIELVGTFGNSWRSTYDERLATPTSMPPGSLLQYWESTGAVWIFQAGSAPGAFLLVSPNDEHATLQFDVATKLYTMVFPEGGKRIFNSNGYLIAIVDRNSNRISIAYDASNRILSVTDASGRILTFNYTGGLRPAQSISDSVGTIATYSYDSSARLIKVTYADNSKLNMSYDFAGMLTDVTDSNGKTIEAHTYDSGGRGLTSIRGAGAESVSVSYGSTGHTQVTDSMKRITTYNSGTFGGRSAITSLSGAGCASCGVRGNNSFIYDSNGNRTSSSDALGRTTTFTRDAMGNVLSRSIQVGSSTITTSYTYNSFSEVLTATDAIGHTTVNTYDGNGNLLTTTTPPPDGFHSGAKTTYSYNSKGELLTITDPSGNKTTMTYTPAGFISSVTDAQGNITKYTYDGRGNRTSVTDSIGRTTEFSYDSMNRGTKITYFDGSTVQMTYDIRGRRIAATDGNGKTTSYIYDDADNLNSLTDAAGNTSYYTFDTEKNLTAISDALGHATLFAYDSQGRATQTTFPNGLTENYTYDAVGSLSSLTNSNGQTVNFTYDALNRLVKKAYPDSTTVTFTWNAVSRLTQVTDSVSSYQFSYDSMDRLIRTTIAYSFLPNRQFTLSYGYDPDSNRTSLTDPEGGTQVYSYDVLNRVTGISGFQNNVFGFTYDAWGRRIGLSRSNGVNTSYSYNALSQLLSVSHTIGDRIIDGNAYTVDEVGNRTTKTDQVTGTSYGYSYDSLYRLTQVVRDLNITESYSYDAAGNRLSSSTVPQYAYNTSNQLLSQQGVTYTYDKNGNLQTKTDSIGITTYKWDFENRLTAVILPSGSSVTFKYDAYGHRIFKQSASGTVVYIYDGDALVEETDASGTPTARYINSLGIDEPLAVVKGVETNYYLADGLGSITSLTDDSGNIAASYVYDSFGNLSGFTGMNSNTVKYAGREFDSETGLYFYRARYYDPTIGRFISADPAGPPSGLNYYTYVNNSPVNDRDPSGMWSPGAHDQIIKNALSPCGIAERDITLIQQGSRWFDKWSQAPVWSPEHSMRDGTTNQSPAEAKEIRDNFVQAEMRAVQSQINAGAHDQAMGTFGVAIHPLMDSTSFLHTDKNGDPKPWCGDFGCGTWPTGQLEPLRHGLGGEGTTRLNMHPEIQELNNKMIRTWLERVTGQKLKCNCKQ